MLEIEVVWGDITSAGSDVCAVGHYIGVAPQRAELAVDWAVSGTKNERKLLLTELTKRGALRGELGEIAFFPLEKGHLAAVAGMGRPGTFSRSRLEILTRALVGCVGLLPRHDTLATVLIGSGEGNSLKVPDCVDSILRTAVEVVGSDNRLNLARLQIVELHLDRALEVLDHVKLIAANLLPDQRNGDLEVLVQEQLQTALGGQIDTRFGCSMLLAALAEIAASGDDSKASLVNLLFAALPDDEVRSNVRNELLKAREKLTETQAAERIKVLARRFLIQRGGETTSQEIPVRLGFWADQDCIRATAITNTVTVTERELRKRLGLVQAAVERLQNPEPDLQPQYSTDIYRVVVPRDLRELIQDSDKSLVVEVDAILAPVQWEMLQSDPNGTPLGLSRPVARQLRTLYSPRPAEIGSRGKLRALVVGDPGDPKRNHALPAAQEEAQTVWEVLKKSDLIDVANSQLLVGAPADGTGTGPLVIEKTRIPPADYFEVVRRLLSGDFDFVHYCGHARFDPENPSEAGWVFKGGVLTAADLDGMVRAPSLVVANACLSARLGLAPEGDEIQQIRRRGDPRLVAALADEFFHCGVADYIGTAWEVPSEPAKIFAKRFYEELLSGKPIGEAVRLARKSLYDLKDTTCTWGAYQHYGDPTRTLLGLSKQQGPTV
jgi:hypothetical protein